MPNCDIDVDDLNDAIDGLSKLLLGLPTETVNLDKIKTRCLKEFLTNKKRLPKI